MDFVKIAYGLLLLAAAALLTLIIVSVIGSIRSNGEVDYCFVEMWSPQNMAPQFQLQGHRSWRTDRMIGVYPTVEEAKAKADALGCRVGTK